MVGILTKRRTGPIGIDLGSRVVKLVQLSADRARLIESARWDLPVDESPEAPPTAEQSELPDKLVPLDKLDVSEASILSDKLAAALRQARAGRKFRGREAVLCLGPQQVFVQNLRVPKPPSGPLEPLVRQEVEARLPFPLAEAELRFIEAADVRQGDAVRREVIVMACHRPVLDSLLAAVDAAGLRPIAVEVEATALLRCYGAQYRRDEDRQQRVMVIHIGHSSTAVLIAQDNDVLFFKYLDIGGKHFDEAVARHLQMAPADAWALRRHNGDRRADQQDPEVARSVAEATRPIVDRLTSELSMCVRYHSVTFRGQGLKRVVLAGGEATGPLAEKLAGQLDLKTELGDPLRTFEHVSLPGRKCQWDIALGLALRPTV